MSEQERAETAEAQPEAQNQPEVENQPDGLTPVERRILEVERRRFKHQGSKEKAIIRRRIHPDCLLSAPERDAG